MLELIENGQLSRSNNVDRGDLCKNNEYYELKTAVLDCKGVDKNKVFRGNQIRLYQQLTGYIFLTTDIAGESTQIWYIPANNLKVHMQNGDILVSSAHMQGGSKTKRADLMDLSMRKEWGITLPTTYDWSKYALQESQLIDI